MSKSTSDYRAIDYRAIEDPALITVLASPVRQEIVDTLAALGGEASAAELAQQLGRHADGLYYHLKVLCKARLLEERHAAGEEERRYRLGGDARGPLRLAYRAGDEAQAAALRKFAHGLLQVAQRGFDEALETPGVQLDGAARQLWAARSKGWLSRDELIEANGLLERLCALMTQPRSEDRDQLLSLTFALTPHAVQPKRRAAGGPGDDAAA